MPTESELEKPINILIVDDHTVVRQGTRELLTKNPDFKVRDELDSGDKLLARLKLTRPDIILLDINLPGDNGLVLLEAIRQEFPAQKVILFSAHADVQYLRKGLALKANGYLSKTASEEELQQAIYSVMQQADEPVYSKDIAEKLQQSVLNNSAKKLSAREYEILLLVAQGMTNREIADSLILAVKTVDSHVARLIKKLGVSNRSQVTAYAYEQGYL